MVPADPYLYSFIGVNSCLIYGTIVRHQWKVPSYIPPLDQASLYTTKKTDRAILCWHISVGDMFLTEANKLLRTIAESSNNFLEHLVRHGIKVLGHQTTSSNIIVLANNKLDLKACQEAFRYRHKDEETKPIVWRKTNKPNASWQRFEAQHGSLAPHYCIGAVY